ncbi:uncharacterized protein DEA37_0011663 [Paragonimus westermani]|uniref:C2H2-type domain-containing protein n=1 Tax=Paragonimus westermani TaxID=34504 RepID=A0A5J4NMH1_9TREM|nr:uncharacterized protein DEA37_0011663 [Paragonimus westermani]
MLATTVTNPFMSFARNTNGTDLNLLTIMHNLKPETQQLCRALVQHLGSNNFDATSLRLLPPPSPIFNPIGNTKRILPMLLTPQDHSQPVISTPPSATASMTTSTVSETFPPNPIPPISNPANFSMTAAITSALSTNSGMVGVQLLPACSPLLQLAVRQALNECLPNFAQLSIQGDLKISVATGSNRDPPSSHSTTVLKFTDEIQERYHVSEELGVPFTRNATVTPSTTSSQTTSVFSEAHAGSCGTGAGSSRRKSTNPIKCSIDDLSHRSVINTFVQTLSPTTSTSPHPAAHSGPASPSTDSGVLDLSRNGSLAGSAPITPLKDFSYLNETIKPSDYEKSLLDAYQKQLTAFGQLQSAWNRASLPYEDGHSLDSNAISFINNNLSVKYPGTTSIQPHSPNRPQVKSTMRRQRFVNRTSTVGRMCPLRRPNSNRRFPCNQCREEFPSLHTLEEHTMFQHGTYRCHICKAQFTQRSNLQRHALKHVGFKPFECRVCSKAYYRKDHLMRHMEMGHPGYTPRENITVHLTSSESLDFLNRSCPLLPTSGSTEATFQDAGCNIQMEVDGQAQIPNSQASVDPTISVLSAEDGLPYQDEFFLQDLSLERRHSDCGLGRSTSVEFEKLPPQSHSHSDDEASYSANTSVVECDLRNKT